MPKIIPNLSEQDYHSQTGSDIPLFSYSIAKTINSKSCYHAWLQHPLLGNQQKDPTDDMNDRDSCPMDSRFAMTNLKSDYNSLIHFGPA